MLPTLLKLAWNLFYLGFVLFIAFIAEIFIGPWMALVVIGVGFKDFWGRVFSRKMRVEWDEECQVYYHADATSNAFAGQMLRNVFGGRMLWTFVLIVVLVGAGRTTVNAFYSSKRWVQKQASSLVSEPNSLSQSREHGYDTPESDDSTERLESIPFDPKSDEPADDRPGRWM